MVLAAQIADSKKETKVELDQVESSLLSKKEAVSRRDSNLAVYFSSCCFESWVHSANMTSSVLVRAMACFTCLAAGSVHSQ